MKRHVTARIFIIGAALGAMLTGCSAQVGGDPSIEDALRHCRDNNHRMCPDMGPLPDAGPPPAPADLGGPPPPPADLASPAPADMAKPPAPDLATPPLDGLAIYNQYCSGCHGTKYLGASATLIQSAINSNIGGMGSLSFLTPQQLAAIDAVQ